MKFNKFYHYLYNLLIEIKLFNESEILYENIQLYRNAKVLNIYLA